MVRLAAAVDPQLDVIVTTIVPLLQPVLILLFGSRTATDEREPREDSDYDLMLVLRDDADVDAARNSAYGALRATHISADVLTRRVSDYERRQHDPACLEWLIARQGRLLYTSGALEKKSAPPRVRETPSEGEREWVRRSDADYQIAVDSMTAVPPRAPIPDAICFHAHACVEKLLKALIARTGTFPPRTHELPKLLKLLSDDVRVDAELIAACELLYDLYPRSRYAEFQMPVLDEARQAVAAADTVRQRLRGRFAG